MGIVAITGAFGFVPVLFRYCSSFGLYCSKNVPR